MPKRIPLETIVVRRNGKRHVPPIGVPFNFTNEELEAISGTADTLGSRPQAVTKVYLSDEAADDLDVEEGRTGPSAVGDPGKDPAPKQDSKAVGKPADGAQKGKVIKPAPADDDDL